MASGDLVEELVHQFSDPFAFYRELVQNSIDAGSSRIEVSLSFQPGKATGVATASVSDWGEGMNRDIIERFLLTKYRSSKENDLTKIGKFGIGFISVFAGAPDLVIVQTGRDAQSWRVLFKADRSYELLAGDAPFEGTQVTLHKRMSAADYETYVKRSREAVTRWCRHSSSDVTFAAGSADGQPPGPPVSVREPLAVDAPFQVEHVEEGTHIVAGPARAEPAPTGLYNRGLTLLETEEALFPGVALKVVSRYLEHTLTRDNVRRDHHFERAMALAKALIDGPLRQQLPEALRSAAEPRADVADHAVLLRYGQGRVDEEQLWFRQVSGAPVHGGALRAAMKAHGVLLYSPQSTPLALRLCAAGVPVLAGERTSPQVEVAQALLAPREVALAHEAFCFFDPGGDAVDERALCVAMTALGKAAGGRFEQTAVGTLHGAGFDAVAGCVDALGRPMRASRAAASPFRKGVPPLLCLNRAHPTVEAALSLARQTPRLAALLLIRNLAVRHGALDEPTDRALTEVALRT